MLWVFLEHTVREPASIINSFLLLKGIRFGYTTWAVCENVKDYSQGTEWAVCPGLLVIA